MIKYQEINPNIKDQKLKFKNFRVGFTRYQKKVIKGQKLSGSWWFKALKDQTFGSSVSPMGSSASFGAGFTLVEILLVIALVGVLGGISLPIYQSFQIRNEIDVTTNIIVQNFRRAQALSQAVASDVSWGVYIQLGNVTLFKGDDYSEVGRDTSFDEVFDLPTTVIPSGLEEVVFEKFTGEPQATGAVVLTSATNEIRTITVYEKGMVDY